MENDENEQAVVEREINQKVDHWKRKSHMPWKSGHFLSLELSLNSVCFTQNICLRMRPKQSRGSTLNFLDLRGINWGLHATLTHFENKVLVNTWPKWVG